LSNENRGRPEEKKRKVVVCSAHSEMSEGSTNPTIAEQRRMVDMMMLVFRNEAELRGKAPEKRSVREE